MMVTFSRPRDDAEGPTLGPYEWIQVTYRDLRSSPDGDIIAIMDPESEDWFIGAKRTPIEGSQWVSVSANTGSDPWSDLVLWQEEAA